MDFALESSILKRPILISGLKTSFSIPQYRSSNFTVRLSPKGNQYPRIFSSRLPRNNSNIKTLAKPFNKANNELSRDKNEVLDSNLGKVKILMKGGMALGALACVVLVVGCQRVFAVESTVNAGYGVIGQSILLLKSSWPKLSQVLRVFKEQGLILAVLLGLSAFFSMAETSITTLWPWKVYYLIVYV